jgi:hypothetical protein
LSTLYPKDSNLSAILYFLELFETISIASKIVYLFIDLGIISLIILISLILFLVDSLDSIVLRETSINSAKDRCVKNICCLIIFIF